MNKYYFDIKYIKIIIKMEHSKKRKSEEAFIEMDPQTLLNNQEKMISYIYQIGGICENTFHTLGNIQQKLEELNQKLEKIEMKNNYLENSINKINHSFIQELKNKDLEINALKELNKNISEDYNALITSNSKKNNDSFFL
jgi:hypothetical protein